MACVTRLQILKGTTAERLAIVPLRGELVWDEEQKQLYIGDGVTAGGILSSGGINCVTFVINLSAGAPIVQATGLVLVCSAELFDAFGERIELNTNVSGSDVTVVSNIDLNNVQLRVWGR